ncbi:hypothetical protein PFICI_04869 [Pestalotiopsis fici W106-1]|uniref:Rhodopsin domain-containing protein n=1 Tax=Pestalotiopsis fici (strain W106-1 / CGMCC3.15140) TaxID=1229662 RepID=W3XA58_PESFW|nr:uncharacterized protein PFICI_04869 [Pestalotiopsis fici W106-1]ETS82993.1 hypothetical protein PFICI_04869 [Pestalotiopsis fici W106-1]
MSLRQRLAVSFVFMVATFACVSSVVRLFYAARFADQDDRSYYAWLVGVWTIPEAGTGILVASLPTTRVFVQHVTQSKLVSNIMASFGVVTSKGARSDERSSLADTYQKVHESPSHLTDRSAPKIRVERSWRTNFNSGSETVNDTLGNLSEDDMIRPISDNSAYNHELSTLPHKWTPVGHSRDTAA